MQLGNIMAIYPKPRTSITSSDGTVFPYLLKDLEINRANQVWAVDITYINDYRLQAGSLVNACKAD